jgi:hypothetical protein
VPPAKEHGVHALKVPDLSTSFPRVFRGTRMNASPSVQLAEFCEKFPAVDDLLNAESERSHINNVLMATRRREDPFPHVVVENILSPQLYAALNAAWPHADLFPPEERNDRRDLVPQPPGTAPSDKRTATYSDVPEPLRRIWDYFILEINRLVIGPWLTAIFRPEIDQRLELIQQLREQGQLTKDYYNPPYQPQMNVGRLMMRRQGFRLRPHADAAAYLATALYYFPDDDAADAELGTALYRVHGELSDDAISERGKTVYFHEQGINVERVCDVPFRANTLLAFANTARSAHGMQITKPGNWRRAYQSHLSIKNDQHHL